MAIKRTGFLVSVAIGLILVVAAPLFIGKVYETRQLSCFEDLARAHAPLATFNQRFDFTNRYTYPSGDTQYSYHLANRVSGMVIVRRGQVDRFGMSVPDYGGPDILGLYRNTWELLCHPRRLDCP